MTTPLLPLPQGTDKNVFKAQNPLQVNEEVVLEGTVVFSSLLKKTGSFTQHSKFKKEEYGVTLKDPQIVKGEATSLAKHLSVDAYTSPKHNDVRVSVTSSGLAPFIMDKVVRSAQSVPLANELGEQTVQVALKSFKPKEYPNISYGLNAVLIEDANNIVYFGNAATTIANAFGIAIDPEAKHEPLAQNLPETFETQQPMQPQYAQQPVQPQYAQQPVQPQYAPPQQYAQQPVQPQYAPPQTAQQNFMQPQTQQMPYDPSVQVQPNVNTDPFAGTGAQETAPTQPQGVQNNNPFA